MRQPFMRQHVTRRDVTVREPPSDREFLNAIGRGVMLTLQFVQIQLGERGWSLRPDEVEEAWEELVRCWFDSTETPEMAAERAAMEQRAAAYFARKRDREGCHDQPVG